MNVMRWFVRLPRHGRLLAALNRNGIDIERRPRDQRSETVVQLGALFECLREAAQQLRDRLCGPRVPLLLRPPRPLTARDFPHVPYGTPIRSEE